MDFAKEYMESFDSSHDFEHIRRVLRLAEFIAHEEGLDLDLEEIRLASLLHDYKDHKYDSGHKSDLRAAVEEKMVELGASNPQARKVALIVQNVSFTHEIKIKTSSDEQYQEYLKLIKQVPEIGVVQDADRLDAIGAIGIARCFTFTGAKTTQPLYGKGSALEHFEVKLVHLEAMMKTKTGRILAKTRTERLFKYQEWINQEI